MSRWVPWFPIEVTGLDAALQPMGTGRGAELHLGAMGFKRIKKFEPRDRCVNPEHDPPQHIVLEPGVWKYTCPGCGRTLTITVPLVTL